MKIILKYKVGIDVESACLRALSGAEAFKIVTENVQQNGGCACDIKLILMDCNMPIMDGYETTVLIREFLYERNIDQPIISAVTGHSEQFYINKSIASGMN